MPRANGSGTIYRRGNIWWVQVYIDGRPVNQSSKSRKKRDAIALRDRLLASKERGDDETGHADEVLIGELLDDILETGKYRESTLYSLRKVIDSNVRPFFGRIKAARLSPAKINEYRSRRLNEEKSETTVNRELALVRMAYNRARKRTPPNVLRVPYFPMYDEEARGGFLRDVDYSRLLNELPQELKALFATALKTGIRRGELLALTWRQVDFEANTITLGKGNGDTRTVPIFDGDMRRLLRVEKEDSPHAKMVFNRDGKPIKDFRQAWKSACRRAGFYDLRFNDIRRTAIKNMRQTGISKLDRLRIAGYKTHSMERRHKSRTRTDFTDG